MSELSIIKIVESTTVDGPGLRTTIYAAGCQHHCAGCHNPESWNIEYGKPTNIDLLADKLITENYENITFSGGDPFFQSEGFTQLAQKIKSRSNKNIWCYTGYRYEQIIKSKKMRAMLQYIDVLVDGKYQQELRNTEILFRGSTNQRLIDLRASEREDTIVEYTPRSLSPILENIK